MSTTNDKIDPTVTLDKLIALLQGFRDKLTADGNSDTVSRVEALGDEETQSKYYNKFGGGRALAGAILEVDGKVDKKADDLRIVLDSLGKASADTIEGVAAAEWVNVPPEFEVEMSSDIGGKIWMPGASFAIPHLDGGNPVDFPITGWQQDETDTQKSICSLRPFYASDGKLVRGTVEVEMLTGSSTYKLHFKWEYAQTAGGEEDVIEIPMDVVNDTLSCGIPAHSSLSIYDADIVAKFDEAMQGKYKSIRFCSSASALDGSEVAIISRNPYHPNGKVIYTGPVFEPQDGEMQIYEVYVGDSEVVFTAKQIQISI